MNLRGSDIEYNPVFFGYAMITFDEVYLFVNTSQLPSNYAEHFTQNNVNVSINEYNNFRNVFMKLIEKASGKIWISPNSCYALSALVPEKKLFHEVSFIFLY